MPNLRITGWDTGRNQVAMLELLQERLGMDKKESEDLADAVHKGKIITLNFENSIEAANFAEELINLGAKVELLSN